MPTIEGTVFYLQRIALAPGAVVRIDIRDADGSGLGSATHTTTGEQVPIAWSVTADAALASGTALTASATIALDGHVAWVGETTFVPGDDSAMSAIAIRLVQAPDGDGVEDVGGAAPDGALSEAELEAIEVTELESFGGGWTP